MLAPQERRMHSQESIASAPADRSDWRSWCDLADAAARLGRWADVVTALGHAAELNPNSGAVARNLGGALLNMGRFEDARAALRSAVVLEPDNVHGRLTYARLMIDMGLHHEALAEIEEGSRRALAGMLAARSGASGISPDDLAVVREIGLLLDRSNQVVGLRRLLAAAEQAGIAAEKLGYLAASVALRDGRPEDARALLLDDRQPVDTVLRCRLMTRIADAIGDTDEAFAAAEQMNRAVYGYDEWRRRGAAYRAHIRMTARIVTPEWGLRIHRAESDDEVPAPAFLVGFPRSGTTLLDTFLMGHPDTRVIEEGSMLEKATGVISDTPELDWPSEAVMRARTTYLGELSRHVRPSFTGLVVDKHPLNMLRLAVIYAIFPDAKIIFAQRHPCDVVLSGFMQSFQLNHAMASFLDVGDAADFYDAVMTIWTLSHEAVPLAIHTVAYERLTADPGAELRPALEFLGLEWCDDLLDHQATARSRGSIVTASYDQVGQPLNRAPSGRWCRYRKQLEPVLPILLPWAERLGYDID
jgi:tetratricopeptide (TPR) repeat protein